MKKYVGIYNDGPETKLAIVSKTSRGLKVEDLITYGLKSNSTEFFQSNKTELELDSDTILFESEDRRAGREEEPMLSIVLSRKFDNLKNIVFIPSVTEPHVLYLLVSGVPEGKKKDIESFILNKWSETKIATPNISDVRYTKLYGDTYISAYINEYFPVLQQITEFSNFLGIKNPKIPFISSADICLANYVLNKYQIHPDKNYLIVHVGIDSTRILIIQNKSLKHISSYVGIGVQTPGFYDIIINKINLELDTAQVTEIEKIFLCGEITESTVQLTFYGSFPLADVEIIRFDELDISSLPEEKKQQIPVYSLSLIPILGYLSKGKAYIPNIDLLPYELKEAQKFFKLSPAGYIILFFIFIAVVFYTQKYISNNNELVRLKSDIQSKQLLIAENAELVDKVNQLASRIEAGIKIQKTIDTLIVGAERWTEILLKIQEFQPHKRRIWITTIAANEQDVRIQGMGINKYSIPDFSDYLDKSLLKNIITQELREREVNKFEINMNPKNYGYRGGTNE